MKGQIERMICECMRDYSVYLLLATAAATDTAPIVCRSQVDGDGEVICEP